MSLAKRKKAKKAVVLLSGGLDSTTLLYYAQSLGYETHCLIFHYGQKHRKEVKQAVLIAQKTKSPHHLIKVAMPWKGSALTEKNTAIPEHDTIDMKKIPATYVPARNILFLSYAASFAEAIAARAIFIGANAIDYSGYPDCRPEFIASYQSMLQQGLKTGVEGKPISVCAPFVKKTKAQIIRLGLKLKVPYQLTWSCYKGKKRPCGKCDSCVLREKGFSALGIKDPAL